MSVNTLLCTTLGLADEARLQIRYFLRCHVLLAQKQTLLFVSDALDPEGLVINACALWHGCSGNVTFHDEVLYAYGHCNLAGMGLHHFSRIFHKPRANPKRYLKVIQGNSH